VVFDEVVASFKRGELMTGARVRKGVIRRFDTNGRLIAESVEAEMDGRGNYIHEGSLLQLERPPAAGATSDPYGKLFSLLNSTVFVCWFEVVLDAMLIYH
jgi:hypothetical protein